jgi:predicted Zn-dependent peptidase
MTAASTIQKSVLANGVRVLVEPIQTVRSIAIGVWCHSGSRDEQPAEAGISHLIEHMLFKGTSRRTAKQIADEIEGRGGVLNAFTDKEATCFYCRVLSDDAAIALDVLGDMVTNSLLDPTELEVEKGVVLEEIKRAEDEPGDHVHEVHIARRWPDHALGRPVIGTSHSVSNLNREALVAYMERQYRGPSIVVAAAGNVDPQIVQGFAQANLGGYPDVRERAPLPRPAGSAGKVEISKDIEQVHFCIGTDGPSLNDPDLYTQAVLDAILGGGMGSRLFQEIREKRGLAYAIGSYTLTYSVGGAFTVYGGTSLATWQQVQDLVSAEFEKVRSDRVPDDELDRAKRSLSGNLVLALEGMNARMMRMTRNELAYGREVPIEETLARIDAVTANDVAELADRSLRPELVSTTAIGPF